MRMHLWIAALGCAFRLERSILFVVKLERLHFVCIQKIQKVCTLTTFWCKHCRDQETPSMTVSTPQVRLGQDESSGVE
jgi:hypothetical protein